MALTRITKAVLGNENSVMTVSAMLRGEYGQNGVFVGVPCIINQNGIQRVLPLSLEEHELEKLNSSCEVLKESYHALGMESVSYTHLDVYKRQTNQRIDLSTCYNIEQFS